MSCIDFQTHVFPDPSTLVDIGIELLFLLFAVLHFRSHYIGELYIPVPETDSATWPASANGLYTEVAHATFEYQL